MHHLLRRFLMISLISLASLRLIPKVIARERSHLSNLKYIE